jgi:3D (Asp-Asp-Asp) domain-containing protein
VDAGDTYVFNSSGNDIVLMADNAAGTIKFAAGGNAESMRLNSTANLVLKGGTVGANGVGVTFPATQVASSDANCLDDYEEGTWVPTDGSGAGLVFTVSACRYTKVGRLVTVQGNITYPATASAANANISGFPFSSSDGIYLDIKYSDASIAVLTYLFPLTTSVNLSTPGLSVQNVAVSGKYISFSGTYMI